MIQQGKKLTPWTENMREWQAVAMRALFKHGGENFLLEATPGAGKTMFALSLAHRLLTEGRVERVAIVVPTQHLQHQWASTAAAFGIDLNDRFKNADVNETSDFHGVVPTYATVASNPEVWRSQCRHKTLVILDEIHHVGEDNSWGDAIKEAFDPAVFRLAMSGTPFRGDNKQIPYVTYTDGISAPDFRYGYADGLRDNICRTLVFPSYEGKIEWYNGFEHMRATFADELPDTDANQRLSFALRSDGKWVHDVIKDCYAQLQRIRADDQPNAGMLIIAKDQPEARKLGLLVKDTTGIEPVVATSDDAEASLKIGGFAASSDPIIIAVRMVSEGVDIPRLRCCVYATNITSELFFRQALGRIVRGPSDQQAYCYIPRDERLLALAAKIKDEISHEIVEELRQAREQSERERSDQLTLSYPISSVAVAHDVLCDDGAYSQSEVQRTVEIMRSNGIKGDPLLRVQIVRAILGPIEPDGRVIEQEQHSAGKKSDRIHALRRKCQRGVGALTHITGLDYAVINGKLNEYIGSDPAHSTEEQLLKRVEKLERWIVGARREGAAWQPTA